MPYNADITERYCHSWEVDVKDNAGNVQYITDIFHVHFIFNDHFINLICLKLFQSLFELLKCICI